MAHRPFALRLRLLVFVAWAAITLAGPGFSAQTEIHVVGDRSFAPYEYCPFTSGQARGILVDQWRLMGKKNGIRIKYTCYDWQIAQDAISNKQADAIGGMVKSPNRETKFRFITPLVFNPPEYYYYSNSAFNEEPDIQSLIRSKVIMGVTKGDYAEEWLQENHPDINLKMYDTYSDVVEAARSGKLNVFAMEESIASHHLNELDITHLFTRSAKPFFHEKLWAAVQKDNSDLASQLEQAFSKVTPEELDSIEKHWSSPRGVWRQYWDFLKPLLEDNPIGFAGSAIVILYVVGILAVYVIAPCKIYKICCRLRRLDIDLDIEIEIGPVKLKKLAVRWIFLIPFLERRPRVLNALLEANQETVIRNFTDRKTVKDRRAHYITPYVVDDHQIDVAGAQERKWQLAARFRPIFQRTAPCITITGDGGTGKTSLACWIARHALLLLDDPDDADERIFLKITLPVMLEGNIEQGLLSAIHGECNALLEEDVPRDIMLSLIKTGRVLGSRLIKSTIQERRSDR